MFIKYVMRTNIISCTPETSVAEAHEIMRKNNISKLPVADHGKLVGIVTKNDLNKATPSDATTLDMWEISTLLTKITMKKIMSANPVSVGPEEVVEEAARLMVDNQVGCLPVVKDGALVGLVTESDLFHLFTDMFGAGKEGVRATFLLNDEPGQIGKVAEGVSKENGNIISVVTSEVPNQKEKMITMKVADISLEALKAILEGCGKVEDIRQF